MESFKQLWYQAQKEYIEKVYDLIRRQGYEIVQHEFGNRLKPNTKETYTFVIVDNMAFLLDVTWMNGVPGVTVNYAKIDEDGELRPGFSDKHAKEMAEFESRLEDIVKQAKTMPEYAEFAHEMYNRISNPAFDRMGFFEIKSYQEWSENI